MTSPPPLNLTLEFGGGMELLFGNEHNHSISLPAIYDPASILPSVRAPAACPSLAAGAPADLRFLIWWMRWFLLDDKNRPELFSQGDTIRPGILILVNDADWELEGELEYQLQEGDHLVFISTLHGG